MIQVSVVRHFMRVGVGGPGTVFEDILDLKFPLPVGSNPAPQLTALMAVLGSWAELVSSPVQIYRYFKKVFLEVGIDLCTSDTEDRGHFLG